MPEIGGKPKVSKIPKKKSSSSTTKRHFTVVIGSKKHGLYVSSSPSSAARKAVSKLCATNKKRKVSFHIREITQGSKKKTYGPYLGYIEKLAKPIELKGRVIKYKIHVEKIREKTFTKKKMNINGGLHPTCDNNHYSYNNLFTNLGVKEETKEKYRTSKPNIQNYIETGCKELTNDNTLTNLQKKHIEIIITDDSPNARLIGLKNQCKKYRTRQESLIETLYNRDKKLYNNHFKNNTSLERRVNENQMILKHKQNINYDILSKKLNKLTKNMKDNKRKRTNEKRSMLSKISTQLGEPFNRLKATLRKKEKED
jgi:hypothetical protein